MSLTLTLASRNLLHDRLRFIATLVGIVFSVVLVMIQMGLFLGFGHMVSTMIDHASTDLWVVPKGAMHRYRILQPFTAVEATAPPAQVHGRDHT